MRARFISVSLRCCQSSSASCTISLAGYDISNSIDILRFVLILLDRSGPVMGQRFHQRFQAHGGNTLDRRDGQLQSEDSGCLPPHVYFSHCSNIDVRCRLRQKHREQHWCCRDHSGNFLDGLLLCSLQWNANDHCRIDWSRADHDHCHV